MTQGLDEAPLASVETPVTQPKLTEPGTSVSIIVGGITMPSSLAHTFNSASYTRAVLETQTAIGIVPPSPKYEGVNFTAELEYRRDGDVKTQAVETEYRFPHKHYTPDLRVFDLGVYLSQEPVPTEVPRNLRSKHHACHWTLGSDKLVEYVSEREPDAFADRDALLKAINDYDVHLYGLVSYSAAYRDRLGAAWGVPGNRTLHHPGFRIATDTMISSWKRDTALTHRGFFVDRLWLTYHFKNVEPDQGRKDFPPQVLEIVNATEEAFANRLLRQAAPFLKPTPKQRSSSPDYKPPSAKADERRKHPLAIQELEGFGPLGTSTVPTEEQDVVGLFFELIGLGVLRHLRPVYVSGVDDYDGWVVFEPEDVAPRLQAVLPGVPDLAGRDKEGVIEFKRLASDVIEDTANETKAWQEMRIIVCWEIGEDGRSFGGDTISFHEVDEADERRYAGVTHLATLQSKGDIAVFVMALKTVLAKLASVD